MRLVLFLILVCGIVCAESTQPTLHMARVDPLSTDESACDDACYRTDGCVSYTFHEAAVDVDVDAHAHAQGHSPSSSSASSSSSSSASRCYLLGSALSRAMDVAPSLFVSPAPAPDRPVGPPAGGGAAATRKVSRDKGSRGEPVVSRLVAGPLPLDRTTTMTIPQHFSKGCEYTIGVWVWHWRGTTGADFAGDQRRAVFSAREAYAGDVDSADTAAVRASSEARELALLPSVLFGIGGSDLYYMSPMMDRRRKTFLGRYASEPLRHSQWTHLAMSITADSYTLFVDGAVVETAANLDLYPEIIRAQREPEAVAAEDARKGAELLREARVNMCPYSRMHPSKVVNNTVIQVGAINNGIPMSGLIQDLVVVRNVAMDSAGVGRLMAASPPRTPVMLLELMEAVGLHSLEGVCEPRWRDNAWLQASWGMCPTELCGPVCLDPFFLRFWNDPLSPTCTKGLVYGSYRYGLPCDPSNLRDADAVTRNTLSSAAIAAVAALPLDRDLERDIRSYLADAGVPLKGPRKSPHAGRTHLRVLDELREDLLLEQQEVGQGSGGRGRDTNGAFDDGYGYEDGYMEQVLDSYGYSDEEKRALVQELSPEDEAALAEETQWWLDGVRVFRARLETVMADVAGQSTAESMGRGAGTGTGTGTSTGTSTGTATARGRGGDQELFLQCWAVSRWPRIDVSAHWVSGAEWAAQNSRVHLAERMQWERQTAQAPVVDGGGGHGEGGEGGGRTKHTFGSRRDVKQGGGGGSGSGVGGYEDNDDDNGHGHKEGVYGDEMPQQMQPGSRAEAQLAQDVHDLYDMAMLLLTGDESASFALVQDLVRGGASASASASTTDVLAAAHEVAATALTLSMWLADDLSLSQPPVAPHVKWAFPFSSLVSQPIHLALAFRLGFDVVSMTGDGGGGGGGGDGLSRSVLLPVNMHDRLRHSLGGKSVTELLRVSPAAAADDGVCTAGDPHGAGPGAGACAAEAPFTPATNDDYSAYLSIPICTRVRGVRGVSSVAAAAREREALWWVEVDTAARLEVRPESEPVPEPASLLEQLRHELCRHGVDPAFLETGGNGGEKEDNGHGAVSAVSAVSLPVSALEESFATHDESASVCLVAASLYFPVTQFVAAHFGIIESGVNIPEDIRIQNAGFDSAFGSESEVQVLEAAEAAGGNADAQIWLARRHWWGYGGLPPDPALAREYFQMAADQNHPEGLYNMGVMHAHGAGGLDRNDAVAMEYFARAADHHEHPFPMAQHAMGNHFLALSERGGSGDKGPGGESISAAKAAHYFKKAADAGNLDSMYVLAVMLKDGDGIDAPDIPGAVRYLADASSGGHVQSMNYLAHALYDAESWLGHYQVQHPSADGHSGWGRHPLLEPVFVELPGFRLPVPLRSDCHAALPLMKRIAEHVFYVNDLSTAALDAYTAGEVEEALRMYDELAELGVEWAQENAAVLHDRMGEAACAPRYRAQRGRASTGAGAGAGAGATAGIGGGGGGGAAGSWHDWLYGVVVRMGGRGDGSVFEGLREALWAALGPADTDDETSAGSGSEGGMHQKDTSSSATGTGTGRSGPPETCERHEGRAAWRWAQLARRGDTLAMRELARRTELGRLGDAAGVVVGGEAVTSVAVRRRLQQRIVGEPRPAASPTAVPPGSKGQGVSSGQSVPSGPSVASVGNATHAALLYALAASRGDVESLVALGWQLLLGGEGEGEGAGMTSIAANRTAARSAFEAAYARENSIVQDPSLATPLQLAEEQERGDLLLRDMAAVDERIDGARVRMDYAAEKSSGGVAPRMALTYMDGLERLEDLGLVTKGAARLQADALVAEGLERARKTKAAAAEEEAAWASQLAAAVRMRAVAAAAAAVAAEEEEGEAKYHRDLIKHERLTAAATRAPGSWWADARWLRWSVMRPIMWLIRMVLDVFEYMFTSWDGVLVGVLCMLTVMYLGAAFPRGLTHAPYYGPAADAARRAALRVEVRVAGVGQAGVQVRPPPPLPGQGGQ